MDFNAILAPAVEFFSDGIGEIIANFFKMIYNLLFPANAEAATRAE